MTQGGSYKSNHPVVSKRIILDEKVLCERGTSVAVFDYATALQRAGHRVITIFDKQATTDTRAIRKFEDRFETFGYMGDIERSVFVTSENSFYYFLQTQPDDERVFKDTAVITHAVFDFLPPKSGHSFGYVSRWLSEFLTGGRASVVPHIVSLPEPTEDMRGTWKIPAEAIILGRHGGRDSFDIPFVPSAIKAALDVNHDLWFVFVNTEICISHPRVRYLGPIYNSQDKANFIASCDGMIHARARGESFGLAMAEFLVLGKPVFCWSGGRDRNHVCLQPERSNIYSNIRDLERILINFKRRQTWSINTTISKEYCSDVVIGHFCNAFLEAQATCVLNSSERIYFDLKRRLVNKSRSFKDSLLYKG